MTDVIELLAIPSWRTEPCGLDAWTEAFVRLGHPATVSREEDEVWLEVPALRLRGFVAEEGGRIEAVNFELHSVETATEAARLVQDVCASLGWEVHADEPEEDDLDED